MSHREGIVENDGERPRRRPDAAQEQRPWDLYSAGRRRLFLLGLFLVGTSSYIDKNIVGVLLEPIKREFQVSDTLLGLLSGIAFALFYATFGIPIARLADRGDRKRVITLSLLAWSAMTALCGMASSFWLLLATRFGVGAGEAGAVPPAQSLLADYYPPSGRARALGIFIMSSGAGYVIGQVLGGFITQRFGWRAAFLIVGSGGVALAPLAYFFLDEPRRKPEFAVRREMHEPVMVAFRALLGKPAYRTILAAMVGYFLMAYGALVFLVSFMIRVHNLDVAEAGAVNGVIGLVGAIVGSIGGGALADRMAARDVAALGRVSGWGLIATVPFYEFALSSSSVVGMIAPLLLSSILLCAAVPPMFSALHLVCGSRRRAFAVAVAFFFANLLGLGLGPVLTGALSDRFGAVFGKAEGLRYALMTVMPILLPIGLLMLCAARHLRADAEE